MLTSEEIAKQRGYLERLPNKFIEIAISQKKENIEVLMKQKNLSVRLYYQA